jgi:hypothetical protein
MLKVLAEYYRDTLLATFKDISRQLPASLLGVSAATRRDLVGEFGMVRFHTAAQNK